MQLELAELQRYLTIRHRTAVAIEQLQPLGGEETGGAALKQFGYGRPVLVTYRAGDTRRREVLHHIRSNAFGRERDDDRVAAVWLDYRVFNRLPRHVPAVDMLLHAQDGRLRSVGDAVDLLLVTTYQPGTLYADDLLRIRDSGAATDDDVDRARRLARYLAGIHAVTHDEPPLWRRRLRDLIGHGEGIMGLTDSYPPGLDYAPPERLRQMEEAANGWRWRLKDQHQRLRQVHGDFHPFNILFDDQGAFFLLDRSRGEWGEPADDVSCLAINYVFFSLQRTGRLAPPFTTLHDAFWETYLAHRADDGLPTAIQPWYAWRLLVLASPLWYPGLDDGVRRTLLGLADHLLGLDHFDYRQMPQYLEHVS